MADQRRPQDRWRQGAGATASTGASTAPRGAFKGRKRFAAVLVFVALAGVAVGLMTFPGCSKPPVLVSIAVTEYTHYDWPVNPWAEQDASGLRAHFPKDSAHTLQSQTKSLILREFNQAAELSKGQHRGRPVVIHFSALGIVREGEVYALPADAEPGQPGTWIRLDELLEPIRKIQGERLFLLDLRPVVDARLGAINDELFDALNEKLRRMNESGDLGFSVLVSGTAGSQTCWSGELRRSAFGWFLDRGLAGAADTWNDAKKRNDRVAAPELTAYTRESTAAFAKHLGQPLQVPARYGKAADFILLPVPAGGPSPAVKPEAADEYPPWLVAGWEERDRWRQRGDHVRLQRSYRQLESLLLRAELRWLGGYEPSRIEAELKNDLGEIDQFRLRHPDAAPPPRSLTQVRPAVEKHRTEVHKLLEPVIAEIRSLAPKMDDAERKKSQAKIEELRKALHEKPPPLEAAAAILCDAFAEPMEWPHEQRRQLSLTLRAINAPPFIEVSLVHFVAAIDEARISLWKPGTVPLLLDAFRKSEEAVAADPRSLPWISADLKTADDMRRKALIQLLQGVQKDRDEAVISLGDCRKKYGEIAVVADGIGRAWHELDETRLFLGQWAGFLAPDSRKQTQLDEDWAFLAANCRELLGHLKPPAEPRLPIGIDWYGLATNLRERRARIIKERIQVPANASAWEIRQWLAWPHWSARERVALAGRMREAGHALVVQALSATPTEPGSVNAAQPDRAALNQAALRRARQAIDLLTLADDPEAANLERKHDAAARQPDPPALAELGIAIERRWREQLPIRYRQATGPLERERIGWAVHPFDLPVRNSGDAATLDAAAHFQAIKQRAHTEYLARMRDRPDADALANIDSKAAADFARALHELAREQLNGPPKKP